MAERDDNNIENGYTAEERLTAILALLADSEAPIGLRPDLKEIQDWHRGKLNASRAAEVKTHVARDPDCFQMWSDLLAAQASAEASQPTKIKRLEKLFEKIKSRLKFPVLAKTSAGLATAVAVLLAIILLPEQQMEWSPSDNPIIVADLQAEWPYLARTTRSEGTLTYNQKIALQAGLSQGILLSTQGQREWAQVLEYIHDTPKSCAKSDKRSLCEAQTQALLKTGLHASVLYVACLEYTSAKTKSFTDEFWVNQTMAWKSIGDELNNNELQPISKYAFTLNGLRDDRAAQCRAVRELINLAY